ncbi:MAG: tRNA (adenine-N1)-methyltransferase [Candidatus Binatia bacterium]|nr:tRNA (adenine-N1)-methyltransferase [Candidatus Binatia bacterium]
MQRASGRLRAGEHVLFVDRRQRQYLRQLVPGQRLHIRAGYFWAHHLIGLREGHTVYDSSGEPFVLVRPTFAQFVPHLPRQAQPIYPKDIGPILLWGDFYPGARVVEVGVGPGALTIALLQAIGPHGRLVSYEVRQDFAQRARQNVAMFLGNVPHWELKEADVFHSIDERDVDRMVIDLPEPWRLLETAAQVLRPGGVLLSYLPTVLQVKELVDSLRSTACFGLVEVFETLQRFWHVEPRSMRPEHRMVAHTGFITIARRLALVPGEPRNFNAPEQPTASDPVR